MRRWWREATAFTRSPILWAELAYTKRQASRERGGCLKSVWYGLSIFALSVIIPGGLCLLILGVVLLALGDTDFARSMVYGTGMIFIPVAATMHFRLMFSTPVVAANSITREQHANTWECLVMTGIVARTLVLGKWWATVIQVGRGYLLLAILCSCISLVLAGLLLALGEPVRMMNIFTVLLACVAVFTYALLNAGFTASIGLLAGFLHSNSSIAAGIGASIRIVLPISGLLLLYMVPSIDPTLYRGHRLTLIEIALLVPSVTMLDSGTLVGIGLAINARDDMSTTSILVAAALGVAIYLMLTTFILRLAEALAVRQGATPSRQYEASP